MNKFKFGRLGTLRGDSSNASGVPPPAGHLGSSGSAASGAGSNSSASGDHHSRLPEGLANLATKVADSTECLKVIHQRSVRDSQQTAASVESQKQLAEALGIYSQRLRIREGHDEVLVRALSELKDLTLYVQTLREEMDRAIHSKFTIPMDEFVRGDLRDAKMSFKKCEKARNTYDSAISKVHQLNAKGKLNLVKVVEAEKERDALEAVFKDQAQETTKTLADVIAKNQIETLEQLCAYFEEYKRFFSLGYKRVVQLQSAVKDYESVVGGRKHDFRSGGGKVTERVRVSADTLEFKDIDESLWDKETDKRKIALMQLVEDEKLYCGLLTSLVENYRDVLLQDDTLSKKIERADITAIFADVERLRDVHTTLRAGLEEQLLVYPHTSLGAVFAARAQELELYPQFAMSSSTREDALERSKNQSSTVRNFLKSSEEKDEAPLQVLLSLPAGRVLRYEQYLKRLLNLTNPSDPDYAPLSDAIQSLQMLQTSVEQSLEISDRLVKVLIVKNKLQGYEQPLNPLVDRHRRYVREGPLYIFQGGDRKPEEHHFFLFNNLLIYSKKISNLLSQLQGDFSYRYVGTVPIQDVTAVRDLPDTETLRNAFEIVWLNQTMTLCAPTPERKGEWKRDISAVIQSLAADRLFGISLNELMTTRENDREVPFIMEKTISWLIDNNAAHVEGLFRISGMMTEMQHYRNMCDQGVEWDFPPGVDPHVVSGLLKLWIRELPEPLMTFALYDAFIATRHITPDTEEGGLLAERIAETRKLIGQLPPVHAFALQYLMRYLADVAHNCEVNKMNPHNLAIVFGPNLLYKKSGDPFDCSGFKDGYNIVEFLIRHYEPLFRDVEAKRREASTTGARPARAPRAIAGAGASAQVGGLPTGGGVAPLSPSSSSLLSPSSSLASSGSGTRALPPPRAQSPRNPQQPAAPKSTTPGAAAAAAPLPGYPVAGGGAATLRPTPPKALPPTPPPGMRGGGGGGGGGGPGAVVPPRGSSSYSPLLASAGSGSGGPLLPPGASRQRMGAPASTYGLPTTTTTTSPSLLGPRGEGPPSPLAPAPSARPQTAYGGPGPRTDPTSTTSSTTTSTTTNGGGSSTTTTTPGAPIQGWGGGGGGGQGGDVASANTCARCRQSISGKGINALDQRWHTECFVCAHCCLPFQGSYVPYQAKPYCVEDFNRMFGKRCGGCNQQIIGGFLQAMGKDWHPEHFVCSHCSGSLASGFFDAGGQPICQYCSTSLLSAAASAPTSAE